jgi:hypothetical protein
MENKLLDKEYYWEDSYDAERDVSEAIQTLVDLYTGGEWEGKIRIEITHIEE